MPTNFNELANPKTTALMLMEIQEAVIGKETPPLFTQLRDAAEKKGLAVNAGKLLKAARTAGVRCSIAPHTIVKGRRASSPTAAWPRRSSAPTCRCRWERREPPLPEVKPEGDELVMWRFHSPTLFHDSSVDSICRNLGITTVVLTGLSLNLGIIGSTIEAMNRNYRVVIPTDCVAGYPPEYGEMVLKNTLNGLAYLTTAKELAEAWA